MGPCAKTGSIETAAPPADSMPTTITVIVRRVIAPPARVYTRAISSIDVAGKRVHGCSGLGDLALDNVRDARYPLRAHSFVFLNLRVVAGSPTIGQRGVGNSKATRCGGANGTNHDR